MINGARFLSLSGRMVLSITQHALTRLRAGTCVAIDAQTALELFLSAEHVAAWQLLLLGYRTAYGRRARSGEPSWYFRFLFQGNEHIAVLTKSDTTRSMLWITTLSEDSQTEQYRVAGWNEVRRMSKRSWGRPCLGQRSPVRRRYSGPLAADPRAIWACGIDRGIRHDAAQHFREE